MVGAKLRAHFTQAAKARQGARTDLDPNLRANVHGSESAQQAADLVNVSARSIKSASQVIEKGTPELAAAVEHGAVSVSAAAEVARLPVAEQAAPRAAWSTCAMLT